MTDSDLTEDGRGHGFLTVEQRHALGRSARKLLARSALGEFAPLDDVRDPVELITSEDAGRLPSLLPVKYGRMLTTPFAFYRGAAALMAHDLAQGARTDLTVQLCGDAHLSNFGLFAAPDRRLVFDCNDFDETLPGPWEWDLKRLAASIVIAARSIGASEFEADAAVVDASAHYRARMRELSEMTNLEVWNQRVEVDRMLELLEAANQQEGVAAISKAAEKAYTRDSLREFKKLTEVRDGRRRIVSDPPLVMTLETLAEEFGIAFSETDVEALIHRVLSGYRESLHDDRRRLLEQYEFVDLAHKVVGVGSVGTRAWVALLIGRDEHDPLFLQVKEAGASVYEAYLGADDSSTGGERAIAGQRLMQAASDPLLGSERVTGVDGIERDYYVRQLKDWKGSAKIEKLSPEQLKNYGSLCARVLARAHARSGDRVAIAAYVGKGDALDAAIASFSKAYANQNERDYARMQAAVADGRITVREGI